MYCYFDGFHTKLCKTLTSYICGNVYSRPNISFDSITKALHPNFAHLTPNMPIFNKKYYQARNVSKVIT